MLASRNPRIFIANSAIGFVLAIVLSSSANLVTSQEPAQTQSSADQAEELDSSDQTGQQKIAAGRIVPELDTIFQLELSDKEAISDSSSIEQVAYPPRGRWRSNQKHNSQDARRAMINRMPLPQKLNACLKLYGTEKLEEVDKRSPWGIMHAAISLGQESLCQLGTRKLNAIEWLLNNGACRNMRLMHVDAEGRLRTRSGPGFEGHEGQLLAIFAQSGVSPHEVLTVDNQEFKVTDLIRKEMDSCRPATELTFKLIGLSYYLDTDASWTSDDGQTWDIQRLISEELNQPVNGVTCGGTHRLMGLSFTIQRRKIQEKEIVGEWLRAEEYINDYHEYAFSLQNPDGSFSTNWFEGRESIHDPQRRVQTTGHILEWLVYSLDNDQMRDPRLVGQ